MNTARLCKSPRATTLSVAILLSLSVVGCSRARESQNLEQSLTEPGLAEQAQAVRDGRSNQIRLDRTLVADGDLAPLSGIKSQLERINFSRTEITNAGLAQLSKLEKLEQLRLSSPRISDEGLASLGELEHLRFLHLIDMPITDAGLEHLHALKGLESLYLDGTKVTDDGIARLVAALPKVHLHIDDHHHRLDPHGSEHTH